MKLPTVTKTCLLLIGFYLSLTSTNVNAQQKFTCYIGQDTCYDKSAAKKEDQSYPLPKGTWRDTCVNPRLTRTKTLPSRSGGGGGVLEVKGLEATCKDRNGNWKEAQITYVCPKSQLPHFSNNNGQLQGHNCD